MPISTTLRRTWLFAAAVSAMSWAVVTSPAGATDGGLLGNTVGNLTNSVGSITSNLTSSLNGTASNGGIAGTGSLGNTLNGTVSAVTGTVSNAVNLDGSANHDGGGLITAVTNTVNTSVGDVATVDLQGDGLLDVAVDKNTASAIAKSQNAASVQSGAIGLKQASADQILDASINTNGIDKASSAHVASNGAIVLK